MSEDTFLTLWLKYYIPLESFLTLRIKIPCRTYQWFWRCSFWINHVNSSRRIILITLMYCIVLGRGQDPVVQNYTKLSANETLKFLSWNMSNSQIFFYGKIGAKISMCLKTANDFVTNELVKLTMLWTTGPSLQIENVPSNICAQRRFRSN